MCVKVKVSVVVQVVHSPCVAQKEQRGACHTSGKSKVSKITYNGHSVLR